MPDEDNKFGGSLVLVLENDDVTCPRIICANLLTIVGWITIRT